MDTLKSFNIEDILLGDADSNELIGEDTDELLFGDLGSDTLTGSGGMDIFGYADNPFQGEDVSDPERQIIAEEDFITDFDFTEDRYLINARDFKIDGNVDFTAVDSNDADAAIEPGTNIVTLLNSDNDNDSDTPFIAGTAANEIAELTTEDGAGLFIYYNSDLKLNRLVYSSNLNDADADLKIISRQTDLTGEDAVDALGDFSADNFDFENVVITGDTEDNKLVGTADDELLFGDLGSDILTGGDGADLFAFGGDTYKREDSDTKQQIIGEEDSITDFDFKEDKYLFDAADFGITDDVNFVGVDATVPDALIEPGTNVVALTDTDSYDDSDLSFTARKAAEEIAELTTEDGAGFFVFFDSDLGSDRLVHSSNLNDADAELDGLAHHSNPDGEFGIDALSDFSADNFKFEGI